MIIVSPLNAVEKLISSGRASQVVGLLTADDQHPELADLAPHKRLKLNMNDIAIPLDGMTVPGAEHTYQLLRFVDNWDRQSPLLIHCWAGISRSTAAAFITQCRLNPDRDELDIAAELRNLSPSATPNPMLVSHADALLDRKGAMTAAITAIGRGQNAFEGNIFEWPVS